MQVRVLAMSTVEVQPWGVTTPAGTGWESLGQAGTHKGQLAKQGLDPEHSL